jgi:type VI secretion system protein ImpL
MRNSVRAWLAAVGVLLVFLMAGFGLSPIIGLAAKRALLFRVVFVVLGVAGALITLILLLRRPPSQTPAPADGTDDVDLAFSSAQARLRASRSAAESRLSHLPVVLVMGPQGATKSSIVTHSGIDAELLHGEVFRGETVIPTDPVNVWYTQGAVLVEAGGRLLDDQGRWNRLVSHIRASRFAAAVGRGRQASRAAIVCLACDELLKPGASESVVATARRLRARLGDVSRQLGIRLPVYVVFTRADRIAGFTDYVRNFTTEDAQQVLGATLPLMADGDAGWAESQARRLQAAFARIVHALGAARLNVLERENQDSARSAAYEFPREFSKITELAVQFLVDVCRPSQLGLNPFVRGFYFVGVRPVIVKDAAVEAPATRMSSAPASDATAVFNPGAAFGRGAVPTVPAGGGRKVPQWTFLRRLFPDVVFADSTALQLTGSGTRVDLLRRGLIATAAAALLVVSIGMTSAFVGNRSLVQRSIAAAREAHAVAGVAALASSADLERLEGARALADQVLGFDRTGHPLGLSWGLYVGDQLAPALRRVYFEGFNRVLWKDTRDSLLAYLSALPAQRTDGGDFGRAQDALAAYLLSTSEFRRATPELLEPALRSFARDPGTDSARTLEIQQFRFFATELPFGNPYTTSANQELVQRTQGYLRSFGNAAYYSVLLYEGNRAAPAARYANTSGIVHTDVSVPGAFTPRGRHAVDAQLDSVEGLFVRYAWIYGDRPPTEKPRREELEKEYDADYVRHWQTYLAHAGVDGFSGPSDAATKLRMLGDAASPLFGLLLVAAQNTPDDTVSALGQAFQPLHVVVPATSDARGATAGAKKYADALSNLSAQMNTLATASGDGRKAAQQTATGAVMDVSREVAALMLPARIAGDAAATTKTVRALLQQPTDLAQRLLSGLPVADLNAEGRQFCDRYNAVSRKFPVTTHSTVDASVDEVNGIFAKNGGLLWSFYNDKLSSMLTPQGGAKAGSHVNDSFARFFKSAAGVTDNLFRQDGQIAARFNLVFLALPQGVKAAQFELNGVQVVNTPVSQRSGDFTWDPATSKTASVTVTDESGRVPLASGKDQWAPFKALHGNNGNNWVGNGPYDVSWSVPGKNSALTARLSFEGPAVFKPDFFAGASSCVSEITY